MTAKTGTLLIAAAGPILGAIVTDMDAFAQARKVDRTVQFDWFLFGARVTKAAAIGIATGLGASLAIEA